MKNIFFLMIILLVVTASYAADIPTAKEYSNLIGMKLVRIEVGEFMMGFGLGRILLPFPKTS